MIYAAAIYLAVGLWHALKSVDWRGKTFSFNWLPPVLPGQRSWNRRLATSTMATLVTLLWPLYRLSWHESRDPEQSRGDPVGPDSPWPH